MSQENVAIVRCYYERIREALGAYWREPRRSLAAAMDEDNLDDRAVEILACMDEDVEWRNAMGIIFRGRRDALAGVDQLLDAAQNYVITVSEVTDLGRDHVLAVVGAAMRGQGSGIEASQTVFSLITLREGLIASVEEYLDRAEALSAVGLQE